MIARIAAIAISEIKISARNRWIITSVATMTLFSLVLALAGSAPAGSVGLDRLTVTVSSMATLSVYLVPLIALLLSYDAFAGEAERGTLPLLLTYPVSRLEIIAGKFVAQIAVLAVAVFIGFGITAGVLWFNGEASGEGFGHLMRLEASAVALGGCFIAIGHALSAAVRQPGTAASLAIGLWLVLVVLYDIALLGALVADDGGTFTKTVFPWLLVASPTDAFRLFNLSALDPVLIEGGLAGAAHTLRTPAAAPLVSLIAWPLLMLTAAGAIFSRVRP